MTHISGRANISLVRKLFLDKGDSMKLPDFVVSLLPLLPDTSSEGVCMRV